MSTVTADDLGMWTEDGTELPEVVAFDFVEHVYVQVESDGFIPLDADTVEALGWDSTLRDVRYPSYLGGGATGGHLVFTPDTGWRLKEPTRQQKLTSLRKVLFASYMLDEPDGIDPDEYDRINAEGRDALGDDQCERLSQICTGEHWSPGDMARCALKDDDLEVLLDRLDHDNEDEEN